jgi:hypothetical protein
MPAHRNRTQAKPAMAAQLHPERTGRYEGGKQLYSGGTVAALAFLTDNVTLKTIVQRKHGFEQIQFITIEFFIHRDSWPIRCNDMVRLWRELRHAD